jgi:hypothetical protein
VCLRPANCSLLLLPGHDVSRMRQSLSPRGLLNLSSCTIRTTLQQHLPRSPVFYTRYFQTDARTEDDAVTEPERKSDCIHFPQCKLTDIIAQVSRSHQPILNAFRLHRRPARYRHLRITTVFNPNPTNPKPLINDLVQCITRWRTRPRRQQKEQMLKAWKEGKLVTPTGEKVPQSIKSAQELSDIIADIYYDHLETSRLERPREVIDDSYEPLPIRRMANTPRSLDSNPYPPPRLPEVLDYVNDIWSALYILPTIHSPTTTASNVAQFKQPLLPGKCPYPQLSKLGFTQPRPGSYLHTIRPPKPIYKFTSTTDFEQYIYSLSFHRDISPRTGKMIMSALLNYKNSEFLSLKAFRYAITSLITRASDIYSARRLAAYMSHLGIPFDTQLYNIFLLGAMNVESLRSFALLLREMLFHKDIQADCTTWNITLRMGIKLKSTNWVYSVLEVMKNREIPLDQDSLQTVFRVLRRIIGCDRLKEYYIQHFQESTIVPWKPFNVVLQSLCSTGKWDEAWEFLLQQATKRPPPEATLHLLIRIHRIHNEYHQIWKIIGEFRRRWNVNPNSKGIAMLFKFAFERQEFSDILLIWEYALSQVGRWKMDRKMKYKGREFEREYGIPLLRTMSEMDILKEWMEATSSRRNNDTFHRIPISLQKHLRLMKARKLSESLNGDEEIPEDVLRWREIEKTYNEAVEMGVWKILSPPRLRPLPDYQRVYVKEEDSGHVRRVRLAMAARRVESGMNFTVREKYKVWKMVQNGKLKLEK